MGSGCCLLVQNLQIGLGGIISINTSSSVEVSTVCGSDPLEGPVTHSVNISGYASDKVHTGCPGRAGVNLSYIRKYDCTNNRLYFIFSGEGQSFTSGDCGGFASVNKSFSSVTSLSANSSSGPTSVYMQTTQINGYGLDYSGDPISFNTSSFRSGSISLGSIGGGYYLQSFNFEAQCGQLPIATYTFVAPMQG